MIDIFAELKRIINDLNANEVEYAVRGGWAMAIHKKLTNIEYPFTIVYPQKGIFLWVREGNQVDDIIFVAKCP